jgi:hypothetical protein
MWNERFTVDVGRGGGGSARADQLLSLPAVMQTGFHGIHKTIATDLDERSQTLK